MSRLNSFSVAVAGLLQGIFCVLGLLIISLDSPVARELNGFDLDRTDVPVDQIHQGGPPKDGIPSIDNPVLVPASQATFLNPDDRVMGVLYRGEARAYPLAILNWHEVVNDRIGPDAILISYCPLCGTGVAYQTPQSDIEKGFGVSGLLYNSDVLLYDRRTESLWSQILSKAVSGARLGESLEVLPSQLVSWQHWRSKHPDTKVLSTDTGYRRDYERNPYSGYEKDSALYFPVAFYSERMHPKERVLGLELQGEAVAFPFAELSCNGSSGSVQYVLAGMLLTVEYDANERSGRIYTEDGEQLAPINAFWFAWFAFHPHTAVYRAQE